MWHIERAQNGWVVIEPSEYDEDCDVITVYEDGPGEFGAEEALAHLIRESFCGWVQQKRRGGVKVQVREQGWEADEDDCTCPGCQEATLPSDTL